VAVPALLLGLAVAVVLLGRLAVIAALGKVDAVLIEEMLVQ
jgi:hypothetical protein